MTFVLHWTCHRETLRNPCRWSRVFFPQEEHVCLKLETTRTLTVGVMTCELEVMRMWHTAKPRRVGALQTLPICTTSVSANTRAWVYNVSFLQILFYSFGALVLAKLDLNQLSYRHRQLGRVLRIPSPVHILLVRKLVEMSDNNSPSGHHISLVGPFRSQYAKIGPNSSQNHDDPVFQPTTRISKLRRQPTSHGVTKDLRSYVSDSRLYTTLYNLHKTVQNGIRWPAL